MLWSHCAVQSYSVAHAVIRTLPWCTVCCSVMHCCKDIPCIWAWMWWGDVMSIWEGVGLIWLEILMWLTLLYHCHHDDTNLTWRLVYQASHMTKLIWATNYHTPTHILLTTWWQWIGHEMWVSPYVRTWWARGKECLIHGTWHSPWL